MKNYETPIADLSFYYFPSKGGLSLKSVLHSTSQMRREVNYMYYITGIIGLLLIVAPYFFGYSHNTGALWTSLLVGLGVLIVSTIEGIAERKAKWEYWTAGILGLLALAAPFTLGFSALTGAFWSTIVAGILLMVLSGYEVYSNNLGEL